MAKQKISRSSSQWVMLLGALAVLTVSRQGMTGSEVTGPPTDRARAQEEMKQGAQAFRAGKYDEAQEHYRTVLKLDPTQKSAALSLARSIRAQYKPGIADPQNIAKAREAIAVYEKALQDDPGQDEAFAAAKRTRPSARMDSAARKIGATSPHRALLGVSPRRGAGSGLCSQHGEYRSRRSRQVRSARTGIDLARDRLERRRRRRPHPEDPTAPSAGQAGREPGRGSAEGDIREAGGRDREADRRAARRGAKEVGSAADLLI